MKNNKKGFSLPLAVGIVILISVLSITILEYIIPFARDIKGVENSSVSYYLANSGIEEGLYQIKNRGTNEISEDSKPFVGRVSSSFSTISSTTNSAGTFVPPSGEGNSEYDDDWNRISSGNPIQLSIGNGYITDWGSVIIAFRVPDLDVDLNTDTFTLSGSSNYPIINWQLSSPNESLNAENTNGGMFFSNDVLESSDSFSDSSLLISDLNGVDLNGNNGNIENFYSNCGVGSKCTLKFSVVNKMMTDDIVSSVLVPYLEWKIDFRNNEVPLRYTLINGGGRSNGFKKELDVKVATQTVNEAFDFTVFQ